MQYRPSSVNRKPRDFLLILRYRDCEDVARSDGALNDQQALDIKNILPSVVSPPLRICHRESGYLCVNHGEYFHSARPSPALIGAFETIAVCKNGSSKSA